MPYKDLREYIEFLRRKGELKVCDRPVDTRIEIAKVTDKSAKTGGPAILFNRVKGFDAPVVTGLFGTVDRSFLAIDTNKYDGFKKMAKGIEKPIPYKLLKDGPCKEVVKKGKRIDLNEIPVLWHHGKDSHRFITNGMVRAKDPDTGVGNNSINLMAVQGRDWLSIQSNPPHQLGMIVSKYLKQGKPCPLAIAIGTDPATYALSACGIPYGMDELEFIGGVTGKAVEVVRCETSDLEVPATAELVIEGEIRPGDEDGYVGRTRYASQGPFGEVSGYFGHPALHPVINITAITHRKDYIYHGLGTAEPPSEHQVINCFTMHADVFVAAKSVIPAENIVAINPLMGTAGWGAAVAIRKMYPGQARQLIYALLSRAGLKRAIIVDEDIDVFDPLLLDWAVSFRAGADDYIITAELPAIPLDPMITMSHNMMRKVGIDATLPLGGDKKGRLEILRELGPARYPDLKEVKLEEYVG